MASQSVPSKAATVIEISQGMRGELSQSEKDSHALIERARGVLRRSEAAILRSQQTLEDARELRPR
jgi:hypothetical protein